MRQIVAAPWVGAIVYIIQIMRLFGVAASSTVFGNLFPFLFIGGFCEGKIAMVSTIIQVGPLGVNHYVTDAPTVFEFGQEIEVAA